MSWEVIRTAVARVRTPLDPLEPGGRARVEAHASRQAWSDEIQQIHGPVTGRGAPARLAA
jgi:hypothetical protein